MFYFIYLFCFEVCYDHNTLGKIYLVNISSPTKAKKSKFLQVKFVNRQSSHCSYSLRLALRFALIFKKIELVQITVPRYLVWYFTKPRNKMNITEWSCGASVQHSKQALFGKRQMYLTLFGVFDVSPQLKPKLNRKQRNHKNVS